MLLTSAAQAQTTTSLGYTGAPQTYTVPAGVGGLQVDMTAAEGANVSAPGGRGGRVQALLAVRPGQTLTIVVGGQGAGGSGGYATGGNGSQGGGGGGGASVILTGGTALANRVLVAGGGGGSSDSGDSGGNGGGLEGGYGSGRGSAAGGDQAGGGSGSPQGGNGGGPGTGGGGGGYFGGEGGADLTSGGGGSSYAGAGTSAVLHTQGYQAGNGYVTLTTVRTPTLASVAPASASVGASVTLTGNYFTDAMEVRFNGTTATSFTVVSATEITATVPRGATSGPVTVTTPGGTSGSVAFTVVSCAPTRLYVNAARPAGGNGASWATAFASLSDALYLAQQCEDVTQVWVAQGTYHPTRDGGGTPTTGNQSAGVFPLRADLSIYGGFRGTETTLAQRTAGHETILSGDFNGDDVVSGSGTNLSITHTSENAGTVLVASGLSAPALLDGVTVTGAGGGAGLNVNSSTVTVTSCVFTGNAGFDYGGGIRSDYGSLTLTRCVFSRNYVEAYNDNYGGGGVAIISGNLVCRDCVLSGNRSSNGSGGGVMISQFSITTMTNCVLADNAASYFGGAICVDRGCQLTLTGSTVTRNDGNGGVSFKEGGGPGGESGIGQIRNSILWDNNGGNLFNQDSNGGGNVTVGYSTLGDYVAGTTPLTPTGPISTVDPQFVNAADPDGADNRFATADDGLRVAVGSFAIDGGDPAITSPATDLRGAARVGRFDQGAYETGSRTSLTISTAQNVRGAYTNITVMGTGTATLTGPVEVSGAFSVRTGGTLVTACQPITGSGSFTLQTGATLDVCDPQGITRTADQGAVRVTGLRTYAPDADFIYSANAAGGPSYVGDGFPARVRNLSVVGPAGQYNYYLYIDQPLTITTRLLFRNRDLNLFGDTQLVLRSTAAQQAYVVNDGGKVNGYVTLQRYIGTPAAVSYRHLSAPMAYSTSAVEDLATAGFAPRVNPAYNALPMPTLPAAQFPNVFGYDETRGGTTAGFQDFATGYYSPASLSDALTLGRGYSVLIGGNKTPDFVGILHTGDLDLPLTVTGPGSAIGTTKGGWHLLGNPYPQPIDWDLFTAPAGLDASVYVWYSTGGANGIYRTRNASGVGNLTDGLIGVGQGFWVRATAPTTFSFTDALRVEANVGLGRAAQPVANLPRLTLRLAQAGAPATEADEVTVYAEADATPGLDARYDALRPSHNVGLPTLSALIDGQEAMISALPESTLTTTTTKATTVELTATLPAIGSYHLTVGDLASFGATAVELLDRLTNTRYDLTQHPTVTLTATRADEVVAGRFALVLNGGRVSGTAALTTATNLALYPTPTSAGNAVYVTGCSVNTPVVVLDLTGRRVATAVADATGAATLATRGLAAGTYVVRAGAQTTRLVVE
jgi:Glycine rich protein